MLDNYRRSLDWWLVPLARALRTVPPDTLTWLSLVAAVMGGAAFWLSGPTGNGPAFLAVAFVGVGLNAVFDLLDGKVAQLAGKATPRGDYLDHCVDRFSDVAILAGVAFSGWGVRPAIAFAALAGTLLTSYMGTQAQAVGLRRNYGGWLGRADRMVLLLAAPLAQLGWLLWSPGPLDLAGWVTSFPELVLVYFAVVGIATTAQRFVAGLRGFGKDGKLR